LPANPIVTPYNATWQPLVAKTHYVVNEGDYITNTQAGPTSLQQGDSSSYPWVDTTLASGICFQRSQVTPAMVTDGLSCTYMLGEKYVSVEGYLNYSDPGYDQSAYSGVDLDLNRWVLDPPLADAEAVNERRFGSAHAAGCHMAFCDGSVRLVSYQIDAEVHRRLGNRQDGQPVDGSQY
jgi:prepilin-type processing-associated H-X9-DG protein